MHVVCRASIHPFPEEVCACVADVTCAEGATPAITLGHMLTPLPPLTAACSYDPRGLDPWLGACNRGLWAGARVINVPKMGETFNYSCFSAAYALRP